MWLLLFLLETTVIGRVCYGTMCYRAYQLHISEIINL